MSYRNNRKFKRRNPDEESKKKIPFVSMLDIVRAQQGEKDGYTQADFDAVGIPMICGCQGCEASLGPWNSYPSKTGYVRCDACIGDPGSAIEGYATVEEFMEDSFQKDEDSSDEDIDDDDSSQDSGKVGGDWPYPSRRNPDSNW